MTPTLFMYAAFTFLVLANTIMGIVLWAYFRQRMTPPPVAVAMPANSGWWVYPVIVFLWIVFILGRLRETD